MNEHIENTEENIDNSDIKPTEIHVCTYEIFKSNDGTYSICKECGNMNLIFK